MLYDAFVEWCKNKNVKILSVSASAENKQAIGFYHKNGFEDYSLVLENKIS